MEWLYLQRPEALLPMLLGWPCMILALLAASLAVYLNRPSLLIVAAILVLPVSLYLLAGGTLPAIAFALVPVIFLLCRYTLKAGWSRVTWSMLSLPCALYSYLAYIVMAG